MARIPEEDINAIREKADIVDVIGKYIHVQKQGKDFKAVCPFHNDHDPSLTISRDKQIYKCFVCGNGGNVFTFVQNYESVSFSEAVKRVADIVGYSLSVEPVTVEKPVDTHISTLHKIMSDAIDYTKFSLKSPEASEEKQYLERRGLNEDIREKFDIGYNPSNDALYKFLLAKGYRESDITETNVAQVTSTGIHDMFSQRITFPIHDRNGNPIGFSCRTIDPNNPSKYKNSMDTPLFHKSDIVYNAHRAKLTARREGKIFVCEGVTDVIAFARAGIDNAVCTLGTSMTEHQVLLLKNLATKVVICYDGDTAGQNATWRACKMLKAQGIDVTVIDNETGKDPDEIIRSDGSDALATLVKKEISWMDFVFKYLEKQTNFDNYMERREFVTKVQKELNELSDELERQFYTKRLAEVTGFQIEYQPKQSQTFTPKKTTYLQSVTIPDGLVDAEEAILAMAMANPSACIRFQDDLGYLTDDTRNETANMIVDYWRRNSEISIAGLIDTTEDQKERDLITKLADSQFFKQEYDEKVMEGCIRKIKLHLKEKRAQEIAAQLTTVLNDESALILSREYAECLKEIRRYRDEEEKQ